MDDGSFNYVGDPVSPEEVDRRVDELEVKIARLEANLEWVKKLSVTNVMISSATMVTLLITIVSLALQIHH